MSQSKDPRWQEWLVIAADGTLGSAVSLRLRQAGIDPWETTRRKSTLGSRRMFWELGQPLKLPVELHRRSLIAVIATGGPTLRECEADPLRTHQFIVRDVARLSDDLRARGARCVYFSTNLVFDGLSRLPDETTPPNPQTEYGCQKLEIEQHLLGNSTEPRPCVLRLTKTLGNRWPLLTRWADDLNRSGVMQPHADMVCALLSAEFVAEAVYRAALRPELTLLHVSPRDDIPYVAIARRWADRLGRSDAVVVPRSAEAGGLSPGMAPAHTALDAAQLERTLKLQVPSSWVTLESLMTRELQSSVGFSGRDR